MEVSRRDFVKICGAGAAVAGLSSVLPAHALGAAGAATSAAGATASASPAAARLAKVFAATLQQRLQEAEPLDPLVAQTVEIAANMEPVILHDDQAAAAQKKLAALEKKTGKKPNILIYLMDNVGYGDVGINGGGLLAGAPTPNIDRLGQEGLHLLSTYSQPSCTPTRVTLLTGRLPMRTGALHPGYPEVRRFWLEWIQRALEAGAEIISIRTDNHASWNCQPFTYGYNEPALREYSAAMCAIFPRVIGWIIVGKEHLLVERRKIQEG